MLKFPTVYSDFSANGSVTANPTPTKPGVLGELYVQLALGTPPQALWALADSGSVVCATFPAPALAGAPESERPPWLRPVYDARASSSVLLTPPPNVPRTLSCQHHTQCSSSTSTSTCAAPETVGVCQLSFGTGNLYYAPRADALTVGSTTLPRFYVAQGTAQDSFPLPLSALFGFSHYKYAFNNPLGPLCSEAGKAGNSSGGTRETLINPAASTYNLFAALGKDGCMCASQRITLDTYGAPDGTVHAALTVNAPPEASGTPHAEPLAQGMLPFYAIPLTAVQVGSITMSLTNNIVILDHGTSGGGAWSPAVTALIADTLARYTGGLTGLPLNASQTQGVYVKDLAAFPPIALHFGRYVHVLQPADYMIPAPASTSASTLLHIFTSTTERAPRGNVQLSIAGNLALKNLRLTFDLRRDVVELLPLNAAGNPTRNTAALLDVYPSPAPTSAAASMKASISSGASLSLPHPPERIGIAPRLLRRMQAQSYAAAFAVGSGQFAAAEAPTDATTSQDCCLYDPIRNTFQRGVSLLVQDAPLDNHDTPATPTLFSPRVIALLLALCIVLMVAGGIGAAYAHRVKTAGRRPK